MDIPSNKDEWKFLWPLQTRARQYSGWCLLSTVKHVDMKVTCCQVANAALILIMVPFFNVAVYPLFAKCNLLKTSLQRIAVGFFCAALSFGVSGLLDLQLEVFWISY